MSEGHGFGLQGEKSNEKNFNPDTEEIIEKLVPGKLIGFRRFRFDSVSFMLKSMLNHVPAMPGENTAEHIGYSYYSADLYSRHCNAPAEGCFCGFYGYYTPELIDTTFNSNAGTCCAVVEVWGKVILGTKGFRAQKMKILGVVAPDEVVRCAPTVGMVVEEMGLWAREAERQVYYNAWGITVQRYGVREYPTIEDMVSSHPPQDVSHLIPTPDAELPEPVRGVFRPYSSAGYWGTTSYSPFTPTPYWSVPPYSPSFAPSLWTGPASFHVSSSIIPGHSTVALPNGNRVIVPDGWTGFAGCFCDFCEGGRIIEQCRQQKTLLEDE